MKMVVCGVNYMNDDKKCVVFCSPTTASELVFQDSNILESLVVTTLLPNDTVYLVEKDEFLEWLEGNEYATGVVSKKEVRYG